MDDMSRQLLPPGQMEEDDLEAPLYPLVSSASENSQLVHVIQYIVYSPSFQVPAFYFVVSDSSTCIRHS
jgi:hypothetical protein